MAPGDNDLKMPVCHEDARIKGTHMGPNLHDYYMARYVIWDSVSINFGNPKVAV